MSASLVFALVALVASVVLLMEAAKDPLRIGAVVVAGLQVLIALNLVHLSIAGVSLRVVFGGALTVLGVILFLKVGAKTGVAASTALTLVGALELLSALHVLR